VSRNNCKPFHRFLDRRHHLVILTISVSNGKPSKEFTEGIGISWRERIRGHNLSNRLPMKIERFTVKAKQLNGHTKSILSGRREDKLRSNISVI